MADEERDYPDDQEPMVRPLDHIGRQDDRASEDVVGREGVADMDADIDELDIEDEDDRPM
jgi:hypothetical protein